jgi:transglutaminase-like putative cysteine protease
MYDVRQFKPTLYFLLLLGVTGFALAAQTPGLWVVATGGILLNAWLVKTRRFTPMSRILANIVTLAALGLVTLEVRAGDATPILTVGQFIVLLHLVKLFEQRGNRDYAQLLVLSLLLMVAAAISTASLLFAIMFIAYLFLSLHCCLLFHLKVEVDQARKMNQQPVDQVNPATLRENARELPRSMRRLTGLISIAGVTMAVLVFLFFPRGTAQNLLGPLQAPASQALSGFNDQVGFQKVAQITRSEDVVARVELYQNDKRVTHPTELLLRGSVLSVYTGNDVNRGIWQWQRSPYADSKSVTREVADSNPTALGETINIFGEWKQVISLEPTGTDKLFAIAGAISISTAHEMSVRYSPVDGVLQMTEPRPQPLQYTVVSSGQSDGATATEAAPSEPSFIDPAVAAFARQPDVCGADAAGQPLAQYPLKGDHTRDHEIAANMERYLRTNFGYTLDLTNLGALRDRDPMAAFLTDFKRGHCEYFAGAMTLMCQSLGIPARFVVGFRCEPEDFNSMGDYFVVKQSNAHAWCEVLTGSKWETFDPTSGRGTEGAAAHPYIQGLKKFFDYLEYKWATSVVAYDTNNRKNVIEGLDTQMFKTAGQTSQSMQDWMTWWQRSVDKFQGKIASQTVLSYVIGGMIALCIVAVVWFLVERWRLHRRARRIGIELMSAPEQLRLARQLRFYDDLLRILARHRIERPRHFTPLEFSRSLTYLPSEVYRDIYRLTEVFYRIRYNGTNLPIHPRRHLTTVVYRIQQTLDGAHADSL